MSLILRSSFFLLLGLAVRNGTAQNAPTIQWQRCYGGTDDDVGYAMSSTLDGGYVMAGCAGSTNGDIAKVTDAQHGGKCDYWVAKIDGWGNIEWKRLLDGTESDVARAVIQKNDGTYLVAGSTASNDIDVSGNHGDFDVWIVHLSNDNQVLWKKCYGGTGFDDFGALALTHDGGFVFCAATLSANSGHVGANQGSSDFWVVKANSNGDIQWSLTYGGSGYDKAIGITPLADGSFVVCGFTDSQNGDVLGNHSADFDGWAIKISPQGKILWSKCYGGSLQETFYHVQELNDGSLLFAGYATSADGDLSENYGEEDGWLVLTTAQGDVIWSRTYGGSLADEFRKTIQLSNGQIIAGGYSKSADNHLPANYGEWDAWIMALDTHGNVLWSQNYGGLKSDVCFDLTASNQDNVAFIGYSNSPDTLDVSGNHGKKDYWVVKLPYTVGIAAPQAAGWQLIPNPATGKLMIYTSEPLQFSKQLIVRNALGQVVQISSLTAGTSVMDVSALPAGMYVLEAEIPSGIVRLRFVKQ